MKNIKTKKSLYGKMLQITLIPIFLLALIITSFSARSFANALNVEVKKGLMDLSSTILTLYDQLYPGDYQSFIQDDALYMVKGEHQINGDFSIIDTIKENTGVDITFFYQDTRVITTLCDENGKRIIGTKVNSVVIKDVLENRQPAFYPEVSIDEQNYFAYYAPLMNDDGSCVGMLFVAKPTKSVYMSMWRAILPIIFLGAAAMLIAGAFAVRYSHNLMQAITRIGEFLERVAKGELNENLDYNVSRREDELGELGRHAVYMQKSLSELVEKDGLTGLFNRRSGEKKLKQVHRDGLDGKSEFCIALGDIDFFKRVNDTYGHECGDVVLVHLAQLMRRHMTGKGIVSRWGGEEFLLIFTDCSLEEAKIILEKIMQEIRETDIIYDENIKIRVTMTFGICQGSTDSVDTILREADGKLYTGKNNGRNQIVQ